MRECIILAGGMGTRLQSVITDLPKCMAPINGNPFLFFVFEWLKKNDFTRIILSLGYKSDAIIEFSKKYTSSFEFEYVIEEEPLGTGGAIALSLQHGRSSDIFIINGDTFFDVNLKEFLRYHKEHKAELTIAAKPLRNYNRYGSILCLEDGRIIGFTEKKATSEGNINGGIYLLNSKSILLSGKEGKFSFETDVLEKDYLERKLYAFPDNGYFIDIGIPEDYYKAEKDFKKIFG